MNINRLELIRTLLDINEEVVNLKDLANNVRFANNVKIINTFIKEAFKLPLDSRFLLGSSFAKDLIPSISLGRRAGHTTAAIKYLKEDPDTTLIMSCMHFRENLVKDNPDLSSRILTPAEFLKSRKTNKKKYIIDLPLKYFTTDFCEELFLVAPYTPIVILGS